MTTSTGLIIVTKPGLIPPRSYLDLARMQFPTAVGMSLRFTDPAPELALSCTDEPPHLDDLVKLLEENKDVVQTLWFGKSPTKFSAESEQPFVILRDEKQQPTLACFIEGEYFTKNNVESANTDEFLTVDGVLAPWLNKTFIKMCVGDYEKFKEELLDPDTEKMIDQMSGNRGIVVLHSIHGDVFKYAQKDGGLSHDFEWGWVSNKLGFEEKTEHPEGGTPVTTNKTRDLLKRGKSPVSAVVADTKSVAEKNAEALATITNNKVPEPTKTETTAEGRMKWKPAAELLQTKNWNKIKAAYEKNGLLAEINMLGKKQMMDGVEVNANDEYIAKMTGKKALSQSELKEHYTEKLKNHDPSKAYRPFTPTITPKMKDMINALLESEDIKAITSSGKVLNTDNKEPPPVADWSAQMGRDIMEVLRWNPTIVDRYLLKCEAEKDFTPAIMLVMTLIWTIEQLLIGDVQTEKGEKVVEKTAAEAGKEVKPDNDPPPSADAPKPVASTVSRTRDLLRRNKTATVAA